LNQSKLFASACYHSAHWNFVPDSPYSGYSKGEEMLSLSARVSRGPHKGRPLVLARNRRGRFVTAPAKQDPVRIEHRLEEAAARAVYAQGHGAWFSLDGRGGHASFHKPRKRLR
jgi:hypothetical protein